MVVVVGPQHVALQVVEIRGDGPDPSVDEPAHRSADAGPRRPPLGAHGVTSEAIREGAEERPAQLVGRVGLVAPGEADEPAMAGHGPADLLGGTMARVVDVLKADLDAAVEQVAGGLGDEARGAGVGRRVLDQGEHAGEHRPSGLVVEQLPEVALDVVPVEVGRQHEHRAGERASLVDHQLVEDQDPPEVGAGAGRERAVHLLGHVAEDPTGVVGVDIGTGVGTPT